MAKGFPVVSLEKKQEILNRIKEKGERVPDLAQEYGIAPKNIYNWLAKIARGPNTALELAKLKREHAALLAIVGELMLEGKKGGKK